MMPKNKTQPYPPQKTIAVDVDGTLFLNGILNEKLRDWCKEKKAQGFTIMLWSARGKEYAQLAATKAVMNDVFDAVISKPGYVVDDQGWQWTKYTRVINTFE